MLYLQWVVNLQNTHTHTLTHTRNGKFANDCDSIATSIQEIEVVANEAVSAVGAGRYSIGLLLSEHNTEAVLIGGNN